MGRAVLALLLLAGPAALAAAATAGDEAGNHRTPRDDADLRYWLANMVWHHGYAIDEITLATGLPADKIEAALKRFDIAPATRPKRGADAPLLVLPYPGGKHPRIGFRDGAIRPQRETKVSVFPPWADGGYVVVDVPEAIFSNLGLTYLAHTHIPTIWTREKIELEKLEWNRQADGSYDITRKLPNGVSFGTKVVPGQESVAMELWLTNGTKEKLTDLRVQVCVLLAAARGFEQQDNKNKVFKGPYAACRDKSGRRWVITAWDPLHRAWGNEKCPCIHSDPRFPDCAPGETQRLRGRLWFFMGDDIMRELERLETTPWRKGS